jgi:anti-sigma B factor antagonist
MQFTAIRSEVATIQACGALDAANALQLHYCLQQAVLAEQNSRLVVDLGQAESIDSASLMALVAALKFARRLDKRLALCSVSPAVRMILEMTQLDRAFEIVQDCPLEPVAA